MFGNRLLIESDARAQSALRRVLGGLVRRTVGLFLGRSDVDTQCGFKGFAGPVADALFDGLRIEGFLFDVELTLMLVRAGVALEFLPVRLVNQGDSTVRMIPTALRSLREGLGILRLRAREDGRLGALRRAVAGPPPR